MSKEHTIEEKANMVMACVSMLGVANKGEFLDVLKYIIANDDKFFIKKETEVEL